MAAPKGVLDYWRRPKPAFERVAAAFNRHLVECREGTVSARKQSSVLISKSGGRDVDESDEVFAEFAQRYAVSRDHDNEQNL